MMMNKCTEKTQHWPDTLSAVSPHELEAFFAHAELCPYHAEQLRAEGESLRAMFLLTRGRDRRRRTLRGKKVKTTREDHEVRFELWQAAAQNMKPPFKRIYLSNCGEDIAGSGKFYDFRRYEGEHSLDPQAGLQIWGVLEDEGKTEEVLLGFYPLAGVRHTGKEKLLTLDNGYIVGLKVAQLGERLFNIEFRCVESEVIEREEAEALEPEKRKAAGRATGAGGGSSFYTRLSEWARNILSHAIPSRKRLVRQLAMGVAACLFIGITVRAIWTLDRGDLLEKPVPASDLKRSGSAFITEECSRTAAAVTAMSTKQVLAKTKAVDNGQRQGGITKSRSGLRNTRRLVKPPRAGSTTELEALNKKGKDDLSKNDQTRLLMGLSQHAQNGKPNSKQQAVWYLQSSLHSNADENRQFVVHMGIDNTLKGELLAEIHRRDADVVSLGHSLAAIPLPQQFTVVWGISREEKFVTLQAVLTAKGVHKVLSFPSEGDCTKEACNKALKDALFVVYAVMRELTVADKTDSD